jgi:erythronate-4-phosphate dehydrogenase
VARAYDLPGDDRRLRASLETADPGKAFDLLRKQYPVRHEFPSYHVMDVPAEKRELASRLGALGFRPGP